MAPYFLFCGEEDKNEFAVDGLARSVTIARSRRSDCSRSSAIALALRGSKAFPASSSLHKAR